MIPGMVPQPGGWSVPGAGILERSRHVSGLVFDIDGMSVEDSDRNTKDRRSVHPPTRLTLSPA